MENTLQQECRRSMQCTNSIGILESRLGSLQEGVSHFELPLDVANNISFHKGGSFFYLNKNYVCYGVFNMDHDPVLVKAYPIGRRL